MSSAEFREYYYLKEELVDFCRQEGLHLSGGKVRLGDAIAHYLDTGQKPSGERVYRCGNIVDISEDDLIGKEVRYSECHRRFFRERIGDSFKFKVPFQRWLKSNPDKTYGDAVEAYHAIMEDIRTTETIIDRQFEYNTYIRDFFKDNKGLKLKDAIACWKFKKAQRGHNRYERKDLIALE